MSQKSSVMQLPQFVPGALMSDTTRIPYSTQEKLQTSGTGLWACGAGITVRGMGWSNGQYSTLTTMWTIRGFPFMGASGARSTDI